MMKAFKATIATIADDALTYLSEHLQWRERLVQILITDFALHDHAATEAFDLAKDDSEDAEWGQTSHAASDASMNHRRTSESTSEIRYRPQTWAVPQAPAVVLIMPGRR